MEKIKFKFKFKFKIVVAMVMAISSSLLWARPVKYIINRDHSSIDFSVDFMAVSKVKGRFDQFQGTFIHDSDDNSIQDVEIEIDASSINTGNKMRDRHLIQFDFFNVTAYPSIVFRTVPGQKFSFQEIKGHLNLKGQTRPLTIKIRPLGEAKDPWKKDNFFFEFQTFLLRSHYKLEWNKSFEEGKLLVGDRVELSGYMQAQVLGERTVPSKFMIPLTPKKATQRPPQMNVDEKKEIMRSEVKNGELDQEKPREKSREKLKGPKEKEEELKEQGKEAEMWDKKLGSLLIVGFFGFSGPLIYAYLFHKYFKRYMKKKYQMSDEKIYFITSIVGFLFCHIFFTAYSYLF